MRVRRAEPQPFARHPGGNPTVTPPCDHALILVGFQVPVSRVGTWFSAILAIGLALRLAAAWTQTYVLYADETMQYFEQGHRLAFGMGAVPWEFADGIRSWLLPGLIGGIMRVCAVFSDDPMVYVRMTRTLCVALSMSVAAVGFRLGLRAHGLAGAILTGGFCAIWFDLVYFAPVAMTEVLAAHCAIIALYLGESGPGPRRAFWIGALLGLAVCLRYQYAPALAPAVLWRVRDARSVWVWLCLGFLAALLPIAGILDLLTLGLPFQSIWLNFVRNTLQGVASGNGTEGPFYYLAYLMTAFPGLPVFLLLAAIGARRFPSLAIAAAGVFLLHSLVPHKEVRFIYLTLAASPILIGLGCADLLARLPRRAAWMTPAVLAGAAVLSAVMAFGPALGGRWAFTRGTVHVFLAAHRAQGLSGLKVMDMKPWMSGGYTYLHRDVPLTFDPPLSEVQPAGTTVPLRFRVERGGAPVPRRLGPFSHIIAEAAHRSPGTVPEACFPGDARPGEPELCLFRIEDPGP